MQSFYEYVLQVVPAFFAALISTYVWLLVCRHLRREQDVVWAHRFIPDDKSLPVALQSSVNATNAAISASGSPSDRLFFFGINLASVAMIAVIISYMLFR